jgi:alpha-aminoadipate/glutamate carrier protein LysW
MISCAACDAEIDVDEDELDEGDTVTCDECGSDMRVVSVDPLELEALEEEENEEEPDPDGDEGEADEHWK